MVAPTLPLVSVIVNNTTIPQVIYKGQPVLTASAIAAVHVVQPVNIRSNFNNNRKYFTEGVDYFQHEEVQEILKETGGVYVAPEAVDDDNTLLFAKARILLITVWTCSLVTLHLGFE